MNIAIKGFLSLVLLFILPSSKINGQQCGLGIVPLNADGTFESLAGVASGFNLNKDVTGGGWTNGTGTADSWLSPLPDTTQFQYAAGLISSPDGGIFAGVWSNGGNNSVSPESFFSTVTFLDVGKKHIIKFYMANAGFRDVNVGDSAQISISFGSETKMSPKIPFLGYGNQVWLEVTMEFFPTDATQQLTVSAVADGKQSYMAIDGISMVFETGTSNTPPVGADDGNSLDEGGIISGNVLNNDSDVDGDLLSVFSILQLPQRGSLTFENNGSYTYQHDGDEFFSDIFTYLVTDGECFDTADVVLSINPINDRPTVVQDTFYVNEGDTLTVLNSDSLLIVKNDIDPDNPNSDLRAVLTIPPFWNAGGIFSIGNRGAFQYIHGCNNATTDIFQYKVSDGALMSSLQDSVIIIITNEPPIGENDFYDVDNGQTLAISDELDGILVNDSDPYTCDTLISKLIQAPSYHVGPFTLNQNGTFTYIHDGSFVPQDFFVYKVSDVQDDALDFDTVFINIQMPNPTTQSYTFTVDEGNELVVDTAQGLLSASSSNVGLPLTAELYQDPSHGNLLPSGTINTDGSFIYKHDCSDTPEEDYFLFKVKDSLTESIDTVFITINNVCPIGINDFYSINEGQTISIDSTLGVLLNDTDDNPCDQLTATLVAPPLYHVGPFTLGTDGSFIYTHDDSENFQDQFSYRLSDGECSGSVYTVILGIDSVDDKPPIANNDGFIPCIKEGDTLVINTYAEGVLGNDTDPDVKDSILSAILIDNVSHGILNFNDDGTFSYVHDGGEDLFDFFTYIAYDGDFNSLDTAVATICIDQVNDCPVAFDDSFIINEGFTLDSTVANNDIDEDINTNDNIYTVISPPAAGNVQMRSDGSFSYIPPLQISPPGPQIVTFEYEITDPDPTTSCSSKAKVTIRINSINDCPIANDDTINVDATDPAIIVKDIIANDTDIDNPLDSSSIFILVKPKYGDLVVNDDGTISYDYIGSPSKTDSIVYAVQDSIGCISNYAKVIINISKIQFPEYELSSYFTPNGDRFNDFFTIKYKNISSDNVKFEVRILDRYQRVVHDSEVLNDIIWDGIDRNTLGDAKNGIYFYEITPIEFGLTRARTIVGVLLLDR